MKYAYFVVGLSLLVRAGDLKAQVDQATLLIAPPSINGSVAEFPLSLSFTTALGEELVYFSLDVSANPAGLTGGGTDFSAFSFVPASPLLDGFDPIPGSGFGVGALASVAEYDTFTTPLAAGSYALGVLAVDYAGSSLPVGDLSPLLLAGADSVIGVEAPGAPSSFSFIELDVEVVPEPSTTLLACTAATFPALSRRKFRRLNLRARV